MSYRIRPASKNSQTQHDRVSQRSMVQFPMPRTLQPLGNNSGLQQYRSVTIRLENVENNVLNIQDLWRRQRDIANAGYLDVQKKLDLLQYKVYSNQKDLRQLNSLQLSQAPNKNYNDNILSDTARASQNQVIMLKQMLNQQRQSQREDMKYQFQKIQQLSMKQLKIQHEMKQLLNQQNQENNLVLSTKLDELKNYETQKTVKINSQYQYMKSMIDSSEQRIIDELQRKIRNQTVVKDYIEDKVNQIRQQIAIDQKGMLSKEGKFIKQIKQSIQAVFTMTKNVRRQFANQLSETQKLAATNFKKISMSVDMLKQKITGEISQINQQNEDIRNQMTDMKNYVNAKIQQNREMIMEIQDEAIERDTIKGNGSRILEGSRSDDKGQSAYIQKQFKNWKTMTEQKNLNVFKQISNALKTMKTEWKKENDEISSLISSYEQNLGNVKKSVPLEIKKSIQAIITIFNNEFDTLAQELDTITEMISLSKKQIQQSYKQEIKASKSEILKEVKQMIKVVHNQIILSQDKALKKQDETIRLHVEEQVNFAKNLLSQKQVSLQTQIGQVSSNNKKNQINTNNQIEEFVLKLKSFNQNYKDYLEEQRKDDMKKRIQLEESMRKNTSSLMDIYYKKCQFLVEGMKKAIQMNNLKEKTVLNREIQAVKQQNQKQMFNFKQQNQRKIFSLKEENQKKTRQQKQQNEKNISILKEENQKIILQQKEENQKKIFHLKEEVSAELNEKMDKLVEQRENSEEIMHEAFDQQINNLKKTLSIEIGNSKLEMAQKINQLVETMNQLKSKESDSTQELEAAVQSAKEAIWKLEARSFAQQAKNKALMDRFGEDMNDLSLNLSVVVNEFNSKNKS